MASLHSTEYAQHYTDGIPPHYTDGIPPYYTDGIPPYYTDGIPPQYWISSTVLMVSLQSYVYPAQWWYPSIVIMVSLYSTDGMHHSTEQPPIYWWYPLTELMVSLHGTYSIPKQSWIPSNILRVSPKFNLFKLFVCIQLAPAWVLVELVKMNSKCIKLITDNNSVLLL